MKRYIRWAIAAGACIIALTGGILARNVEAGARIAPELPDDIQPMVRIINDHRRAAGLAPLVEQQQLTTCADRYSEILADQGRLSHTAPDGSNAGQRLRRCGYQWRHYGENLAAGQQDAAEAVAAWMASPSHRHIILSPRLREIGVGYTYRANDPARYVEYYVLAFGTR